jgi:hypothetical protein
VPASPSHGKPKQRRGEKVLQRFLDENHLVGSREKATKSISGCGPPDPRSKDKYPFDFVHACT